MVKWTAESDQHLLLKVLETTAASIDYSKVATAWSLNGDKPTAKAISERIAKLKRMAKSGGTISGPSTPSKPRANGNGNDAIPKRTPATKKTPAGKTPLKSATENAGKRERDSESDDYGDDDEYNVMVKKEPEADDTPSGRKKQKVNPATSPQFDENDFFSMPPGFDGLGGDFDGATDPATSEDFSELW